MTNLPDLWPDDIGAYCPEIPDAISFREAARELARDPRRRLTEAGAFRELLLAYWSGELGGLAKARPSALFTLQRPQTGPPDYELTEGLKVETINAGLLAADEPYDTLIRDALYWAPSKYAGFIARYWYVDGAPQIDLPDLASDAELMRWLAALPLEHYPAAALQLLGRLHLRARRWTAGRKRQDETKYHTVGEKKNSTGSRHMIATCGGSMKKANRKRRQPSRRSLLKYYGK